MSKKPSEHPELVQELEALADEFAQRPEEEFDQVQDKWAGDESCDVFEAYFELNPAFEPRDVDMRSSSPQIMPSRSAKELLELNYESVEPCEERAGFVRERRVQAYTARTGSKVKQLTDNKSWAKKGPATPKDFYGSDPTFSKIAQQVLTHHSERMIFNSGEETTALGDIIIDQERISNTLLRNLGLDHLVPPPGTRYDKRAELLKDAEGEIRLMLANIEQIQENGSKMKVYRIMRVTAGPKKGCLIGTRIISFESKILFGTSVIEAYRSAWHKESGYQNEIEVLEWMKLTLKEAKQKIVDAPKITDLLIGEVDEIKNGLIRCFNTLSQVTDKDKVALREALDGHLNLTDRRGRSNKAAIVGSLGKAGRKIESRLTRIQYLSESVGADKTRIGRLLASQSKVITPVTIQSIRDLDVDFSHNDTEQLLATLRDIYLRTKGLIYEPYLTFGEMVRHEIAELADRLTNGEPERAKVHYQKLKHLADTKDGHRIVEECITVASLQPETASPEQIYAKLQSLPWNIASQQGLTEAQSILKELIYEPSLDFSPTLRETVDDIIEEIGRRFTRIGGLLKSIRRRTKKKSTQQPPSRKIYTDGQKVEALGKVKDLLKSIDFIKLMNPGSSIS